MRARRSARHYLHEAVGQLDVVGVRQREESHEIRRRHEPVDETLEELLTDRMQPIGKLADGLGELGGHINDMLVYLRVAGGVRLILHVVDAPIGIVVEHLHAGEQQRVANIGELRIRKSHLQAVA